MCRTVVKTIIITSLFFILFVVISLFIGSVFFPSEMGNFCADIGIKKSSLIYAEKAYVKSGDITNLSILVDRAIYVEDNEKIAKYSVILISHEDFNVFCNKKDNENEYGNSTYNYYCIEAVSSLYKCNKKLQASEIAVAYTSDYSNRKSALGGAIVIALSNKDKDFASMIKNDYNKSGKSIVDESGTLNDDLALLNKI